VTPARAGGGDIGIFLRFDLLDWRHFTGTDLTDLELTEPGHRPVLAWRTRPARVAKTDAVGTSADRAGTSQPKKYG
jgi:hypothetical protein